MRKFLTVFLPVFITICCLTSPALAAGEAPSYSDVPADAWYAPYIEVCAQAGVMQGVGNGLFEPDGSLGCQEGTALLLRLYDVLHGGNGAFPAPPEDWIPVWVEDETGKMLFAAQDYTGWHSGHSEYSLCFRADQPQSLVGITGVVCLGSRRFSGSISAYEQMNGSLVAALDLSAYDYQDQEDAADAFHTARFGAPSWAENAWYYAQHNSLDEMVRLGGTHTYQSFAIALEQICGEMPVRFHAEYVPHFAQEDYPEIYRLRDAGIWSGINEAQTPYLGNTYIISRANAAIMVARVLDESLRLESDPDALPHEGYSLSYLMDEPPTVKATYPVIPMEDGLLTLSGQLIPWPHDQVSLWDCWRKGEYLQAAFYQPREPVRYDPSRGAPGCCRGPDLYGWIDGSGQLVTPLSPYYNTDPPEPPAFERPYTSSEQGIYYAGDRPVSQKFDWCGDLDRELRGFVGLDGKIYRIQFEQ